MFERVTSASQWGKLLGYYRDCLEEEHRLQYAIEPDKVHEVCFFSDSLSADFIRDERQSCTVDATSRDLARLKGFVLPKPGSRRPLNTCFGYPFYVTRKRKLIPLLYVELSAAADENSVILTRESSDLEMSFAAIWEVLPGDRSVDFDDLLARFRKVDEVPGCSRFERTLNLMLAQLEEVAGYPVERLDRGDYRLGTLPMNTVVDCPMLFHVQSPITAQVLKELNRLQIEQNWEDVPPALRQMLGQSARGAYPLPPEPAQDPRLYVRPANNKQRQAILSAEQRSLTVVTGPPGTGKSQLIVNIVGNAVLRGESVLIASRNNQAVNTISERFLDRMDYPGAVRTGNKSLRDRLPAQLLGTFARVHNGGLTSRIEQVRSQHEELLKQIDAKSTEIERIRAVEADQRGYEIELAELLALLPEAARDSFGKVQIRLGENEYPRLMAVTRGLFDEVDSLLQRVDQLAAQAQAVLVENQDGLLLLEALAVMERETGQLLDEIRCMDGLGDLEAIEGYLSTWERLLALLAVHEEVRHLEGTVAEAKRHSEECQGELPAEWLAEVEPAMRGFKVDVAQELRGAIAGLQEQIQALAEPYRRFFVAMEAMRRDSGLVRQALDLVGGDGLDGSRVSEDLGLADCERFFGLQGSFLGAHQSALEKRSLQAQVEALLRERETKLREFDSGLADLNRRLSNARMEVPAALVARVEVTAEQGSVRAWSSLATQLRTLDGWAERVASGKLSLIERLRKLFSPLWPARRIQAAMLRLKEPMNELGVLALRSEPAADEPFPSWVSFVHETTRFVTAVHLLSESRELAGQLESYRQQIDHEIDAKRAGLSQIETCFQDLVLPLPERLSTAMAGDRWPLEPVGVTTVDRLNELREQYRDLSTRYSDITTELVTLLETYSGPKPLRDALPGDSGRERPTPETLLQLLAYWHQFLFAVEARTELQRREREHARKQGRMNEACSHLPRRVQAVDWAGFTYTQEMDRQARDALQTLRRGLRSLVAAQEDVCRRGCDALQQNSLGSDALAKALAQAVKNPNYLSGLLLDGSAALSAWASALKGWLVVFQAWNVMSRLADVGAERRLYPTLDDALRQREKLMQDRQSLAGKVLSEQWRHAATQLEPEVVSCIGSCLNAMEALTQDVGYQYRALRNQVDSLFADTLKIFPVWSTTNLSTQDLPLTAGLFDCVVIDEASQCDIPSALPLLFRAKRAVIIGDQMQLRHIANLPGPQHGQLAAKHDIGPRFGFIKKSLFDLAASSVGTEPGQIMLDEHYRSHEEIIGFSSEQFYSGQLSIRTRLNDIPLAYQSRACGVYWVDVQEEAHRAGAGQVYHTAEAIVVADLISALLPQLAVLGLPHASIGVVTPFHAQKERIKEELSRRRLPEARVLVGTIHTYQGDERDIMIFSMVATKELPEGTLNFVMRDANLLNVAVTRARLSLFIVGNHAFFQSLAATSPYCALASYATRLGHVVPEARELPVFLPLEEDEKPFDVGAGRALQPRAPYTNRMTLRRLLASCQEFVWWYDRYMNLDAIDSLSLALAGADSRIREVRLLASDTYWEKKGGEGIQKKHLVALKRELKSRGIRLQLAITRRDDEYPAPHDRYLFAANRAVNMPPVRNIYQETASLAEFLPSTVRAEEFEEWWQKADLVFE